MSLVIDRTELNKLLTIKRDVPSKLERTDSVMSLPGQPRIQLHDRDNLLGYVRKHLSVKELDDSVPYFWFARVGTPFHGHISPLHHQAARNRTIIVIETPMLHLIWHYERIFVKPIPAYLLSHAFWTYLKQADPELWKAAAGFVRTYTYLIQYERDFDIAQSKELGLIPKTDGHGPITYDRFVKFITPFEDLLDEQVSQRYQYGELRLSRLNKIAPLMGKWVFHQVEGSWLTTLISIIAPFVPFLLVSTTVLNAMQVELTVEAIQIQSYDFPTWGLVVYASRWFSIIVMFLVVVLILFWGISYPLLFIHDLHFASKIMRRRHSNKLDKFVGDLKSGIV